VPSRKFLLCGQYGGKQPHIFKRFRFNFFYNLLKTKLTNRPLKAQDIFEKKVLLQQDVSPGHLG
jgi:hypothetical protein